MAKEVAQEPVPYRNKKGQFIGPNPWTQRLKESCQAWKRYCIHGHPLFGDNLRYSHRVRVNPKTGKIYERVERVCSACSAERQQRYKAKKRQRNLLTLS
jgi:GrpB-like predicted nucleotidyltransferase (UPF0157 family)